MRGPHSTAPQTFIINIFFRHIPRKVFQAVTSPEQKQYQGNPSLSPGKYREENTRHQKEQGKEETGYKVMTLRLEFYFSLCYRHLTGLLPGS